MLFFRQTWALVKKNLLVVFVRHGISTPIRCFILPVVFVIFLTFARNLFVPPSKFGIGEPNPVRSITNALQAAGGGRNRVVFVNNGYIGGDIERVINRVADDVRAGGKTVEVVANERDLLTTCRNTLRGYSTCYGAAVFQASPSEGVGGIWQYNLRADGGLANKVDTTKTNNDVQVYPMSLQHAVDFAIATVNQTVDQSALPSQVNEYPYTDKTPKEREDNIRVRFMGGPQRPGCPAALEMD